jgi:hypothetical protein
VNFDDPQTRAPSQRTSEPFNLRAALCRKNAAPLDSHSHGANSSGNQPNWMKIKRRGAPFLVCKRSLFFVSAALPPLIQFASGAAARSQLQKLVIVAATFKPLYLSLLPEGCPARAPHFINKLSEKYLLDAPALSHSSGPRKQDPGCHGAEIFQHNNLISQGRCCIGVQFDFLTHKVASDGGQRCMFYNVLYM